MMILVVSISALIAFSCITDSSEFNTHIMEGDQNDITGIIVIFKPDVTVEINEKKQVQINGVNELDELLHTYNASIEKLLYDVDESNSEHKTLERYYVVHTRVNPEKLRDELIKFKFIEAAYIKSKDEDPGME